MAKAYSYAEVKDLVKGSVPYAGMFSHTSDKSKAGSKLESIYIGFTVCATKKGIAAKLPDIMTKEQAVSAREGELMLKATLKADNRELFARGFPRQWADLKVGQTVPCTYQLRSFDAVNKDGKVSKREAVELVPDFLAD